MRTRLTWIVFASLLFSTTSGSEDRAPDDPVLDLARRPASMLDVALLQANRELMRRWSMSFFQNGPFELRTIEAKADRLRDAGYALLIEAGLYPLDDSRPTAENCAQAAYWLRTQLYGTEAGRGDPFTSADSLVRVFFMSAGSKIQDEDRVLSQTMARHLYLDVRVHERSKTKEFNWAGGLNEWTAHCRLRLATENLQTISTGTLTEAMKNRR